MANNITGLPYDLNSMDEFRKNGCIIDMNDVNFPNISEQDMEKVAFIFLRNTDYENVEYDFSKCSFDKKSKYLKDYLTIAINYKIDILVDTWIAILCQSLGMILENTGILSSEEITSFIEQNQELVGETVHFLISLPVYAVKRYEFEGNKIDITDIEKNEFNNFSENIVHLLTHAGINLILETETIFKPEDYVHYFTDTNDLLFEVLQGLPYMAFLVGMTELPPEKWNEFLEDYNEFVGKRD